MLKFERYHYSTEKLVRAETKRRDLLPAFHKVRRDARARDTCARRESKEAQEVCKRRESKDGRRGGRERELFKREFPNQEPWTMVRCCHVPLLARVELQGLSTVGMNGKVGHVKVFDDKNGRLVVLMEGRAPEIKRVKPQNVVSAWEEGPLTPGNHARFAFRTSDNGLVCREHACEACGGCCTDFGLLNQLCRQQFDGFDDARAKNVTRTYFQRPAQVQIGGGLHRMADYEYWVEKLAAQRGKCVDVAIMLHAMSAFQVRSFPAGQTKLHALSKLCLSKLLPRDRDLRKRTP
eukprot:1705120-Rhodomonas_salina.1